jgi:beta-lactamase superfamily II metal-dependent hydrolase
MKSFYLLMVAWYVGAGVFAAQGNGKFQLHFMDVGDGDGAVLISPKGEVVLFDDGVEGNCDLPLSYLLNLGITKIDYHITSHYHADHIGCAGRIFDHFPVQKAVYDRGGTYDSKAFNNYLIASLAKRQTAKVGEKIILDKDSSQPVVIEFVALNGAGVKPTGEENNLSLVSVIHFGKLDIEMGGDLSGVNDGQFRDIETLVAPKVGQVEVFKVHHHGSKYATNNLWLSILHPKVAIISTGGTAHNPDSQCLNRLHLHDIKTYWTERGNGAKPNAMWDRIGGNIVIVCEPGCDTFTVNYANQCVDSYQVW